MGTARAPRLGIVGSEGAKFTPTTEALARAAIRSLIDKYNPTRVISGGCHLGGVDIWAVDEALKLHLPTEEYVPEVQQWDPPGRYGYKKRNEDIVRHSDVVVCITLDVLPAGFTGPDFGSCYHHKGEKNLFAGVSHVKSGGCWTMELARRLGKHGELIVIQTPVHTDLVLGGARDYMGDGSVVSRPAGANETQPTRLGICTNTVQSPAGRSLKDIVASDAALGTDLSMDGYAKKDRRDLIRRLTLAVDGLHAAALALPDGFASARADLLAILDEVEA